MCWLDALVTRPAPGSSPVRLIAFETRAVRCLRGCRSMARVSVACLLVVALIGRIASANDSQDPVKRRALLVGCTDYELASLPDLWGPFNDVPAWSRLLINLFGFADSDVRTLVGGPKGPVNRPTRDNESVQLLRVLDSVRRGHVVHRPEGPQSLDK